MTGYEPTKWKVLPPKHINKFSTYADNKMYLLINVRLFDISFKKFNTNRRFLRLLLILKFVLNKDRKYTKKIWEMSAYHSCQYI